jgi:MFS family permease
MTTDTTSWSALFQGRRAAHTVLLTSGIGVNAIGLFIIATVLPSVVRDIGGTAFYAWATMLYTMASVVGTACGGLVRARLDFRPGYMVATLLVLVGVLGCAMAPQMGVLLLARTMQGFGSGMLIALAYSIVGELYPEALRARVFSAISGMWGIAALLGPLVGGIFATSGWWRGAFWIFIPVLLGLGVLAWFALPPAAPKGTQQRLPLLRLTLLASGVLCVALSGHMSSLSLRLGLISSAIVFVGSTFSLDARTGTRLFPAQPWSLLTPVGIAYWIFFLFGLTTSQVTVYLPLMVQVLYDLSPLAAGYFAAALSAAWTVLSLYTAGFQNRQVRRAIIAGPLLFTSGVLGQAVLMVSGPLSLLGVCVCLSGAGIGTCFAHISSRTIASARPGESALTASAIPTMQLIGIAFGAAVAGLVANAAGLSQGVSFSTVEAAATWVYRVSLVSPIVIMVLSWRLVRHGDRHNT